MTALALLLTSSALGAQESRAASTADSVPSSVAEAEEQGRRFAPLVARAVLPAQFSDSSVVGSPQRRCVRAHDEPIIRAGDFLVGPFARTSGRWRNKKLWWVPASRAGTLRVTMARIDGDAPMRVLLQPGVAHPTGGDTTDTFHPTVVPLYDAGTWILVASSGSSWGCVIVEVA